jgi:Zn ribbon nucleic-acid-binding protein
MLKLKSCPRCKKGDIALDRDQYGWYEYCIQCGYMDDLAGVVELGQQQAHGVKQWRSRVKTSSKGR